MTNCPDFCASLTLKLTLPYNSRRFERSKRIAFNARTRPSLRVRRRFDALSYPLFFLC